jgi:hypothetical protein
MLVFRKMEAGKRLANVCHKIKKYLKVMVKVKYSRYMPELVDRGIALPFRGLSARRWWVKKYCKLSSYLIICLAHEPISI